MNPKLKLAMASVSLSKCLSPLLFLILQSFLVTPFEVKAETNLYIVYMGERQHEDPNVVTASHHDMLASFLGSKEEARQSIVYSYKHGFSGFAATLTELQAKHIAEFPGVLHVVQSRKGQMQTTRSWDFLGLDYHHQLEILGNSKLGDDVIIGVVDTGIWPESKSFNDDGYGPIPSRWKGKCVTGQEFNASHCNRKIIGARWYANEVNQETIKGDYLSPRDVHGHGTHCASTAAGSLVNASYGYLNTIGEARGGAPRSRLAVYKVLWGQEGSGSTASILAAVDDAIHDGVDVLSLSIVNKFLGDISIGYLHAVARGITVVFAGGNTGPRPQSIQNIAPWVITVAASTIDRSFPANITLGNEHSLVGQPPLSSVRLGNGFRGLYSDSGDLSCSNDLNATIIKGKVVLCFMGNTPSPDSQFETAVSNVQKAGGLGLIFAKYTTNLELSCGNISCVLVDYEAGIKILNYIGTTSSPKVKINSASEVAGDTIVAPRIAYFSSRGPNAFMPAILKPDITAPGVMILAAKKNSYEFMSGTSMATPHIAGVVALVKAMHPNWSPSAIKSAIITTASVIDKHGVPITAEGVPRKIADPFDYGGGHVNPKKAIDPGLIYDIDAADYFKFHCYTGFIGGTPTIEICDPKQGSILDLNLPSISIPNLKMTTSVWRTVTNVGEVNSTYNVIIASPPAIKMDVEPSILVFNTTITKQSFKITFSADQRVQGDYTFGSLTWDDKKHSVRIPIAVRTVIQDSYADVSL